MLLTGSNRLGRLKRGGETNFNNGECKETLWVAFTDGNYFLCFGCEFSPCGVFPLKAASWSKKINK